MPQPIIELPCIAIDSPQQLKVSLPFGGELRALTNIADGPPTNCALAHSLMLQVAPLLGSMTCIMNILKVIAALKNFVSSPPTPSSISDMVKAIDGVADCLGIVLGPIPICKMVKDILLLIVAYLSCLIEALDSILKFQASIDLTAAQGNPLLHDSLICAQDNANATMKSLQDAMVGIGPLIEMVNTTLSIVGQDPIALPPMTATTPSAASLIAADPLKPFRDVVQTLNTVANALPC